MISSLNNIMAIELCYELVINDCLYYQSGCVSMENEIRKILPDQIFVAGISWRIKITSSKHFYFFIVPINIIVSTVNYSSIYCNRKDNLSCNQLYLSSQPFNFLSFYLSVYYFLFNQNVVPSIQIDFKIKRMICISSDRVPELNDNNLNPSEDICSSV